MVADEVQKVKEKLISAENILILYHHLPDGDSLGSALALYIALKEMGKKVKVAGEIPIPRTYNFLPLTEEIYDLEKISGSYSCVIFVDCTDLKRIKSSQSPLSFHAQSIINVDHHVSNSFFGDINYVSPEAEATVVLIYRLLKVLPTKITPAIATCLYTGLVTDTGSFQYEAVSSDTLKLGAELLEIGANLEEIRLNLWENKTLASMKLLGVALTNFSLTADGKIIWVSLSQELLKSIGAKEEDAEGIINNLRSIEGVEIAILLHETAKNLAKVSLRSKSWADVNKIACLFGGGGHPRAAGCVIESSLEKATQVVLRAAKKYLKNEAEI